MPIESLQSRASVTAYATGDGSAAALPAGTIEARVTAILENGLARFATAFGFVDLATPEPLAIGARAQLLVENTGIRILLTQLGTASAAANDGAAATGSALAAVPSSVEQPVRPPPAPVDQPATRLAAAARAATATQQSPAALLSRLMPLLAQAAGALPPEVQRASSQLLSVPLRADQPLDPALLQAALRQSGLFREARGAGGTAPDWKQALIALRSALSAWTPQAPQTTAPPTDTAPDPERQPAPQASQDPTAREAADDAATDIGRFAGLAARGTIGGPTAEPAGQPEAEPAAPDARRPVAPAAQQASLTAFEGNTEPSARSVPPALLGQLVAKAFGAALPPAGARVTGTPESAERTDPAATVVPLSGRARLAPPRADQPPRALPPDVAPDPWMQTDQSTQRDTLLALTEGALDRVRLSQFASLPRDQAPVPGQAQAPAQQPAWVFDVPVLVGREAAVAQFRVSRDGRGSGGPGGAPGERWSMDVAIDTSETGPVHARVRLGGGAVGITLWAERPDMVDRLKGDLPDLRRTLDAAAFTVDDLSILPGSPQAQPVRASGYFLDTRS